MRAVTGEVTSSNPISLSKAAAVLSRFAVSETGAGPDVAAYLRRSVTAFNELVAVHREIRAHRKISRAEEKEGASQNEDNSRSMKKNNKGSYYERGAGNSKLEPQVKKGGNSKRKVEVLGDEKRSEERRYWKEERLQELDGVGLVFESMNTERKKRKHPDAEQGEVNGEIEHQEGKRKNKRRTIEDSTSVHLMTMQGLIS